MKVIHIELSRCVYCRSCEVACENEHEGRHFVEVMLTNGGRPVPMSCRHCEKAPCVAVCPTGALARLEDGPVILQTMRCIGCRLCAMACPFGVLELDALSKVMRKCDQCIHRLSEAKRPACVSTCPSRALTYEELDVVLRKVKEKAAKAIISGVGSQAGTIVSLS